MYDILTLCENLSENFFHEDFFLLLSQACDGKDNILLIKIEVSRKKNCFDHF